MKRAGLNIFVGLLHNVKGEGICFNSVQDSCKMLNKGKTVWLQQLGGQ